MNNSITHGEGNSMNIDNYMDLAGAVVSRAVEDYKGKNSKGLARTQQERKTIYIQAKKFLFTNELFQYLEYFGIDHLVSVENVRKQATA